MTDQLQITLLGSFHLAYGTAPVADFASARLQALLAYLVLHPQAPQPRQQIAFHFWPVSTESQARTNLRKLLLQLRTMLPAAADFLAIDNATITWRAAAPFTCDVLAVQQLLQQLRTNPLDQAALTALVALYRAELLPNCYDDWIVPLRTQLHQDVMAALDRLVTLLENQRAYEEGIRYAQRLLTLDPLEEKSYQRLMRLRAADGDRAGALRVYQECTQILERELGVGPSPETNALYEQLRQAKSTPVTAKAKPHAHATLPPLVGRQQEWQTVRGVWQQAVRGQARFVTIAGEAGIGKTRLAEELLLWAEPQGIAAVRTRAYQAHGALAYAPIAELLQSEHIHQRLQLLNANRLTQVARLLPKLLEEHPNLPPPQPMTESWQRQQFFDALAHAILAAGQPLVILFDDLQWADGETLTWLHFLLRAAETTPLLLVGTVRTGEIARDHPLPALLNSLRRDDLLTEITLSPLNSEEVQALAQLLQDGALGEDVLAQLYADTEGNPLFVVESVRAQQAATVELATGANQSGLPPKIYGVIRNRLAQLTLETQTLVNLAAVIGRSFSYDTLMRAAALDEEEMVDSLDELLTRQIIREQGAERYDFSHDRIRDVAYNEISRTRRRLLHRRVAEALEHLHQDALDAVCGLLAEHHEQAGNVTNAIEYLTRAGDQAKAQFALDDALRYFARVLTLLPLDAYALRYAMLHRRLRIHKQRLHGEPLAAELVLFQELVDVHLVLLPNPAKVQAELALYKAACTRIQGDSITSRAHAEEASQLARRAELPEIEAEALIDWGNTLWSCGDLPQAGMKLYEGAEKARAAGRTDLQAKGLELYSQTGMFSGMSTAEIAGYLQQCLAIHQANQDLVGQCNIYNKLGYIQVAEGDGDYAEAKPYYFNGIRLAKQFGGIWIEMNLIRNLGFLYVCEGDHRQAVAILQDALVRCRKHGVYTHELFSLMALGYECFNRGDFAQADCYYKQGLAVAETVQLSQFWLRIVSKSGLLYAYKNQPNEALATLQKAIAMAQQFGDLRLEGQAQSRLGHTLLGLQRFDEATAAYQQALTYHRQMRQINRSMEPLAGLAQIALQQGKQAEALQLVEQILQRLATHTMERTEEGLRVYRACYQVLGAQGDPRTNGILQTMYDQLQARAATIDDTEERRMFWEAMPGHREIRHAIESL